MPSLGADMDAGTVTEWLVHEGDHVGRGDIVAIVETDKADLDVEVFETGVVAELLVPVGQRVAVGTPLARIVGDDARVQPAEAPLAAPATKAAPAAPAAPATKAARAQRGVPAPREAPTAPAAPAAEPSAEAPVVGPLIRHLAEERHVDLRRLHGSGDGGRITRHDVAGAVPAPRERTGRSRATPRARRLARELGVDLGELAAEPGRALTGADVERAARPQPQPTATAEGGTRASRRDAIARLMSRAAREIPHYYLATRIPLATALEWLAAHNEEVPLRQRVLPAALLLRAVALAAVAVPDVNGTWVDDAFVAADGVHLGVAVALRDGGLLTPTISDVDTKDLATVMDDLRDLVARARNGRLRPRELAGASLTVTNLGDQGVETVFGVIVPPQVALVGFGVVHDEPWAERGLLGVRPVVHVSLAADHRATDGRVGARFLDVVADSLQHPEVL